LIILSNPDLSKITLAACLATSVAELTAIPTSACFKAGASLTPSPVGKLRKVSLSKRIRTY